MAWITGNSYVRINVWETSNTASAVAITVRVETVGNQRLSDFTGTLNIGGTAYTFTHGTSPDRATDGGGDAEVVYSNGSAVQKTGLSFSYNGASTKTISISLSNCTFINDNATGNARLCSANISGSYTATRPIVTTMTTSASSVTLGNSITITTSGGSSGSMTFKIGSSTVETKTGIGNTTTTWTPALATYAPYITSGASATCTITWNGISKSVTVTVPNNSSTKPTVSVSVAPDSGSIYVKGKSKAVATVTASGKYSATITNYAITMNGVTYTSTPATSSFLTTVGSNTCSVTVTDSRGFTNTASATFTVTDYSSPSYTGANVYRSDSSGNALSDGTYITFACTPSITSLSNANAKKMGLQYRTQGSSSWTLNEEVTLSSYTAAVSYKRGGSLSATTVYEARFYLKDSYETVYSQTFTIPTDKVVMDFAYYSSAGDCGGGIGMYTQAASQLDIAWNTKIHGTLDSTNYPSASTQITRTHTTNSYCSSTSTGRVWIRKQGSFGFLHFNLAIDSTSLTSSAGQVEIMRFSGITLKQDEYCTIPSQSGNSTILMSISTAGIVTIYTAYGSASGFYRAEMPLIFA